MYYIYIYMRACVCVHMYYHITVYQYFNFYFIVGLRANQRLYPILGSVRHGGNFGRAYINRADFMA